MTTAGASPGLPETVVEIERHVATAGWDQPPRLYALADTADVLAREPALAAQLALAPDGVGLTPVEQEDLPRDRPLTRCAEEGMPDEDDLAAEWAATHPDRADVRIVVGVLRDGSTSCVLRVRGHESEHDLVRDPEVSTELVRALAGTLEE